MKVLIYGSTYEVDKWRADLTDLWIALHSAINPSCDMLVVDSASPYKPRLSMRKPQFRSYMSFLNNVGHTSHGGRDGWGRAFCYGLRYAVLKEYEYVAFIEGDSLCRLPVRAVCADMKQKNIRAVAAVCTTVKAWPETGLLFFNVAYLKESSFVRSYDWETHKAGHQSEPTIRDILGNDLTLMPWRAIRDDAKKLTLDNVHEYDWISHTKMEIFDAFADRVFNG